MSCINISIEGCNSDLRKDIKYKVAYASSDIVKIEEDKNILKIFLNYDDEVRLKETEEMLMNIVKDIVDNHLQCKPLVIFNNEVDRKLRDSEIFGEMVERKWAVEFDKGLVGYGGDLLTVLEKIDKVFRDWAMNDSGVEYVYPDLLDIETLNRYNYLGQFPNQILFANHLKEDINLIEDFGSKIAKTDEVLSDKYMEKSKYINKTCICVHVYKQFENQVIDKPVILTSRGKCKRYESVNMNSLERLFDFNMREIVLVGSKDFVLSKREEYIKLAEELMKKLTMQSTITTSNDPFFTNEYEEKAFMQKRFKLKYELRAPFTKDKDVAIGSFNYHGTHFADTFNIKSADGTEIHTACVGFGLERFVYAYLSQLGLDEGVKHVNEVLK